MVASAMRLAKYLAHAGVASRRAAEEIVRAGRVTVGEETVLDPARSVSDADPVTVDGTPIRPPAPQRVVYAVNKPAGVVSTASDTHGRPTVISLVPSTSRLYPVGRLDIDTTGLILLTDDGELAYRLTHPRFEVEKTYRATVRSPVRDTALRRLRTGVMLEDGMSAPARVRRVAPAVLELTLHEGRKRQVRRMCEAVGHRVVRLERVAFGPLALGDLAPGAHRPLSADELRALRTAGGLA
jgi:23S rRNA pseudouridine2605 synthase